jgi:hypothetical protein
MIGGAGQSRAMMTVADTNAWVTTHKGVPHMLNAATRDYVGARCCIMNRLVFVGFVLGAQAAEKYLKTVLLCAGQRPRKQHDLQVLLARTTAILPQVARFQPLMTSLGYAYQERYQPVLRPQGSGYSSADLATLDEFVVTIVEHVAIPEEVMCSLLPFHWLFEDRLARAGWQVRDWFITDNAAMAPRFPVWRQRYDEIMDQLHPNRVT